MKTGLIAPLPRERVEDRGHIAVTGWVHERETPAGALSTPCLSPSDAADIDSRMSLVRSVSAQAPLCFLLGSDPPDSLLRSLLDAARQGRSVYVLAPVGFGEGTRDPGLRDMASGRVLVRRTKSVPASALLAGRGETATLWMGAPAAPAAWTLSLTPLQGAALFQAFLHLFWHCASDEAFTTGANLEFRSPKARPFDAPLPPNAPAMLHPASTALPWSEASVACGPVTASFGTALRTLLTSPGRDHHSALAKRVSAGCSVVSNDLDLPRFVLGGACRRVAVGAGDWTLHVDLDDLQAAALGAVVGSVAAAPCWRFHREVPLSAVSRMRVWLEGAKEALTPRAEEVLDAGRVVAPELRLVPSVEPASFPSPHPLSLSARSCWIADPPRLPSGTAEDKLVTAWDEVDRRVQERTLRVRKQLDEAELHGDGVARRLVRLAAGMLGFKRSRDERRWSLERIEQRKPSEAGPEQARKIVEELRGLERAVDELANAQRDAERREEEKLHLEEQQRIWDAEQAARREALAQKLAAREDAEQVESRLRSDHEQAEAAHQAERDESAKKDLYVQISKTKDELHEAKRRTQSLRGEILGLEQALSRPFKPKPFERKDAVAQPAKATGARFVPPPTAGESLPVPQEALPTAGGLRTSHGQRYLVIDRWEDLPAGETEAHRLSAKLVAPQVGK
ncbi:MAG: hypothetical protein R3B70_38095 [Polyangiaceae bacterium]